MDAVLYLGPGEGTVQQAADPAAAPSPGEFTRRLSFARAVCTTYAEDTSRGGDAGGSGGGGGGGGGGHGAALYESGSSSSRSGTASGERAVDDIVAYSSGKVTWVEAWYALHPEKKIKFDKAQCRVSRGRLHCPAALDRCVAPCDDAIIKLSQCCVHRPRLKKPCTVLAYALTVTTVVEIAPVFPIVLYGCFLDDLALMCLMVIAAVVLLSQIPKRCCWRYRPFLDLRAVHMKTNITSSFPSRAVVCATAYSYVMAICLLNGPTYFHPINQTDYPYDPSQPDDFRFVFTPDGFLYLLPFLLTWVPSVAWARVYLGVHYPSDTLAGAAVGLVCCVIGEAVGGVVRSTCLPCSTYECYANASECSIGGPDDPVLPTPTDGCYKYGVAGVTLVVLAAVFVVAILPCIAFFTKSANVLGMVFPAIFFHVTMLCKPANLGGAGGGAGGLPSALHAPNITDSHVGRGAMHIAVSSVFGTLLASVYFVMLAKPIKRRVKRPGVQAAIFTVLFTFIALVLSLYRVYVF